MLSSVNQLVLLSQIIRKRFPKDCTGMASRLPFTPSKHFRSDADNPLHNRPGRGDIPKIFLLQNLMLRILHFASWPKGSTRTVPCSATYGPFRSDPSDKAIEKSNENRTGSVLDRDFQDLKCLRRCQVEMRAGDGPKQWSRPTVARSLICFGWRHLISKRKYHNRSSIMRIRYCGKSSREASLTMEHFNAGGKLKKIQGH